MSSSGKGGTTTQTTDTGSAIPDWLTAGSQNAVQTATDLSNRPYTPYTGEQVAQPTADTQQAYQQVRDMQGAQAPAFDASKAAWSGLLPSAAPITAAGVNDNTNTLYGNYQQNVIQPAAGLLGGYLGGPATASGVGAGAAALMSPFASSVIDPTLAAGEQARQIARQTVAGNANNVGAFGGSRQGVAEGVSDAQTALGTQGQIGQMLTTGWGQALTPATNLALQAGQEGYGAAGTLAGLLGSGYGAAATESGSIAGANQGAGITAAQQLPITATAQQKSDQLDASLLQTTGAAQQTQQQQMDAAAMGDFYQQQNWPVQNLDLLLGTLGGVPYTTTGSGTSTQTSTANRNVAGSIGGGALAGGATGAAVSGGNPYVTAGGAVVGGILGALN